MKKIIILYGICLFIFSLKSKNTFHNLEKYWYYRNRLDQNFMISDSPKPQGTNFPTSFRHNEGPKMLSFGD